MNEDDRPYANVWHQDPEAFDFKQEDYEELYDALRQGLPPEAEVEHAAIGGNGGYEVINVIVDSIQTAALIMTPLVAWMRRRFRRKDRSGRQVHIHGPDGGIIKTITLESESAEPVIEEGEA